MVVEPVSEECEKRGTKTRVQGNQNKEQPEEEDSEAD